MKRKARIHTFDGQVDVSLHLSRVMGSQMRILNTGYSAKSTRVTPGSRLLLITEAFKRSMNARLSVRLHLVKTGRQAVTVLAELLISTAWFC